ncbi:response regulator [Variovorax sp. RCC_210]|uniref:response regulator n=1 Tax=Variovorax sp. RCC_210 TaxID=3239217 RepID=UPI0035234BB5
MALKAILIEDSKTIRDNLIPALSELADVAVIAVAETEDEAIQAFNERPDWDLAIVDLFLRQGTGLTVLRNCQDRQSHQHAIVLTNYPNPEIRSRCMAVGADAVYDKSKDLEAFFEQCLRYR